MSAGDVIESVVKAAGTTDGVPIVNTWHFAMTPGSTPPDMTGLGASFNAVWQTVLLAVLTTEYAPIEVIHTCIAGPSVGAQFIDTSWAGLAGALGPPTAPYTQCLLLQRNGPNALRSNRGRLFLSCCQRAVFNDAGNIVTPPAGTGALEAAVTTNLTDTVPNFYVPSLFNRLTGLFTAIVSTSISQRAGSRRKRRFRL